MHENLVILNVKYKFVLHHYLVSAKIPFFKGQKKSEYNVLITDQGNNYLFLCFALAPIRLLSLISLLLLPIIMRWWASATNLYLRQRQHVQYVIQRSTLQRRWMDLFTFVSCQSTSVRSVDVKIYFTHTYTRDSEHSIVIARLYVYTNYIRHTCVLRIVVGICGYQFIFHGGVS